MNEHDIETLIAESLNLHAAAWDDKEDSSIPPDGIEELREIRTFSRCGVMSDNAGLVLFLDDGSEFQITIVQSR